MDEKGVHILKSGKILNNRYVIEKVLGEGGFGITYKGIDKLLAVEVAVKDIPVGSSISAGNKICKSGIIKAELIR